MADFVINEWLWSDLSGANGRHLQRESLLIIEKLPSSDHRIVVIEGSAFEQKAWNLCKNVNPIVQRIAGAYIANVRSDSNRCLILRAEAVATLPDELSRAINPDDHYLVRAQLTVDGAILVTTDTTLRETALKAGLRAISREEFFAAYL